jgi:hypothetical protein
VMHDRPGDQLWEERHEKREVQKIEMSYLPAVSINKEGDFLKGNERDAYWENNLWNGKTHAKQLLKTFCKESCVFEITQNAQIEGNAGHKNRFGHARRDPACAKNTSKCGVDKDRAQQQEQEFRLPPCVIDKRTEDQPGNSPPAFGMLANQAKNRKYNGQKYKDK